MTIRGSTIVKNAAALMGSQLTTWALSLLLAVIVPRFLGPASLGNLQIANSIWAIAGVFISWGMDTFLTKEIARNPQLCVPLLLRSWLLKTALYVVCGALTAGYVWSQYQDPQTIELVAVIGLSHLILQFSISVTSVLQGLERMGQTSITAIAMKLFFTVSSLSVLFLGFGLRGYVWVVVAANIFLLCCQLYFLRDQFGLKPTGEIPSTRAMLKASTAYLFSNLILVVYGQIDVLIMGSLVGTAAVGWYSGAIQLYGAMLFIPSILIMAVFPAMARSHAQGGQEARRLFHKSFDLTLLMGVPIGLGLAVVSDNLVVLLYGEAFAPSGPVLALMGLTLVFMYQNIVLGRFMVSIDRQNTWTLIMAVQTLLTIGLDIVLVPWFHANYGNGGLGAAVSYIVTEAGMLLAGLICLPRGMLGRQNAQIAARTMGAGLLMLAACWWLRSQFLAVPVVVGVVVYVVAALALRAISDEDLALARGYAQGLRLWLQRHIRTAMGSRA